MWVAVSGALIFMTLNLPFADRDLPVVIYPLNLADLVQDALYVVIQN